MLFSNERRHSLAIPAADKDGKPSNVAFLIDFLCKHVMKDSRKELFVLDAHLYVSNAQPPSLHHSSAKSSIYTPHQLSRPVPLCPPAGSVMLGRRIAASFKVAMLTGLHHQSAGHPGPHQ
jgi:hypothetical protein